MVAYPPYSPYLSPSDLSVPKHQKHLTGNQYCSDYIIPAIEVGFD